MWKLDVKGKFYTQDVSWQVLNSIMWALVDRKVCTVDQCEIYK